MVDKAFVSQLQGFSLTTAEILYRMPDYPSLVQSFVWQEYDMVPRLPRLKALLDFWSRNIEGRLERIRVAHVGLISPAELRMVDGEYRLS